MKDCSPSFIELIYISELASSAAVKLLFGSCCALRLSWSVSCLIFTHYSAVAVMVSKHVHSSALVFLVQCTKHIRPNFGFLCCSLMRFELMRTNLLRTSLFSKWNRRWNVNLTKSSFFFVSALSGLLESGSLYVSKHSDLSCLLFPFSNSCRTPESELINLVTVSELRSGLPPNLLLMNI